jgi:hypothetical protein
MAAFVEVQANLILAGVTELTAAEKFSELDTFCRETGKKISTCITVIEQEGNVICDSDRDHRSIMPLNTLSHKVPYR